MDYCDASLVQCCTSTVCSPAPQVSWSRVGGQLPGSRSSWIKDAGTLLELSNLEESDEAQYKCQGANIGGSEEHIMMIDIQCTSNNALLIIIVWKLVLHLKCGVRQCSGLYTGLSIERTWVRILLLLFRNFGHFVHPKIQLAV